MPFRPSFLFGIGFRAAAAVVGAGIVAACGFAALDHWERVVAQAGPEPGTQGPRWERMADVPATFRRHEQEKPRTLVTRDVVSYQYRYLGQLYRGSAEAIQEVGYEVRRAGSSYPPLVAGVRRTEMGHRVDVWVDMDRPEVSTLVPQRTYVPPSEPARSASPGSALGYTAAALVAAFVTWKLVWRPIDTGRILEPGAARRMRGAIQAEIPETPDVPLPAGFAREDSRGVLHLEFPRRPAEAGDGASWLFLIVFTGGMLFGGGGGHGLWILLPVVFIAVVGWGLMKGLGARLRRSTVEASPAGLVVRRSHGFGSRRRDIARNEIACLEPYPTDARIGRGPWEPSETFFEIAAVLHDGRRVVLGDNISGTPLADTVVRRIGAALGLHPEQCLTVAATVRGRYSQVVDVLRDQEGAPGRAARD